MVCKNTEQKQKHGKSGFESRTDMPKPGITGIRINSNTSGVMMMHMHKNSFTVLRGYAAGKFGGFLRIHQDLLNDR